MNTITLTIGGTPSIVTAKLNGATFASFTSSATASPRRMGLAAAAINVLAVLDYLNLDAYGITSFKAWRTETGEPPSQSGHGTYNSGAAVARTYQDKYHSPIFNANNVVTGYTYNPDA